MVGLLEIIGRNGEAPIVSPAETVTVRDARRAIRERGREVRCAAGRDRLLAPSGSVDFKRRRRFEIAVEIVEGEDLDLDRRRYALGRDGRAGGYASAASGGKFPQHQRALRAGGCGSA
jgi:hypothetical protein